MPKVPNRKLILSSPIAVKSNYAMLFWLERYFSNPTTRDQLQHCATLRHQKGTSYCTHDLCLICYLN